VADIRERVETILREKFRPQYLEVNDESARHAGHAGAASGGGHLRVVIVSETFAGVPPLDRHRLVYAALGSLIGREIHALGIRALPPSEWDGMKP
jgi:BolA family transcriptional regulator, general stress-responsive regulator